MGEERRTASERGYGHRWRQARLTFLAENPLCRYCEQRGHVTAATVVDHIVPHRGDQELFWNVENWQPLCKACHDSAKAREERGNASGCDASGMPIVAGHHWNDGEGRV